MMPVMMPAVGGMPEAIEIPIQSGSATRKTTTEAKRSAPSVEFFAVVVSCVAAMLLPVPGIDQRVPYCSCGTADIDANA